MYLHDALRQRADEGRPVKACLIGAGKFGSMFLSQVPTTPGLEVSVIGDLRPDAAAGRKRESRRRLSLMTRSLPSPAMT